jgi:hypothetical protein
MHRLALALALVAALSLAGCTTSGTSSASKKFSGAEADVAKAVADLQSAAQRKDATKLCTKVLASAAVQRLGGAGTTCKQEMEDAIADADELTLDVQSVTVSATKASAKVRQGTDGTTKVVELVKEGTAWKVSAVSNG